MSLTLHSHPFASFCHKVLIALYENGTPFETVLVDLGDPESTARFRALWPVGLMPVLVDSANGRVTPESSIIIEYLHLHHPGPVRLLPDDPDAALAVRLKDRFLDQYVHEPMQKIVLDRLRPAGGRDPIGVDKARERLRLAYGMLERDLSDGRRWMAGEAFSLADCAAAPALSYANMVEPFDATHPRLSDWLERIRARPSYARVLREAEPFLSYFPQEPA